MRRPPDVHYLRKAQFRAKLNNEMRLTPIPPTPFHVSGETATNGALQDSVLHNQKPTEVPPWGFKSRGAPQMLQTSALLASSCQPHAEPAV